MSELTDSPEVQAFMAAFQKLRNFVDDAPDLIVSKARENNSLQGLCHDVLEAANQLRIEEHSRRELYSSPTNPAFLATWQEYNSKYSGAVGQVAYILFNIGGHKIFGPALDEHRRAALWKEYEAIEWKGEEERFRGSPWEYYWGGVEKSLETRWRESDEEASADAYAIDEVIEEARISIKASVGDGTTDEEYQERVRSGIAAWRRLVNEVGFDLAGVFRRRQLVPFVMIPRHVSGHYGKADPLSLMARLQQAHEAFVYGVPLGALAIMRSILEIILRKHYQLGDGTLNKLIETAATNDLFPNEIRLKQIQLLLKLGNDAVHPNPEKLHMVPDVEKEVLFLLFILRTLIERTPNNAS